MIKFFKQIEFEIILLIQPIKLTYIFKKTSVIFKNRKEEITNSMVIFHYLSLALSKVCVTHSCMMHAPRWGGSFFF